MTTYTTSKWAVASSTPQGQRKGPVDNQVLDPRHVAPRKACALVRACAERMKGMLCKGHGGHTRRVTVKTLTNLWSARLASGIDHLT